MTATGFDPELCICAPGTCPEWERAAYLQYPDPDCPEHGEPAPATTLTTVGLALALFIGPYAVVAAAINFIPL